MAFVFQRSIEFVLCLVTESNEVSILLNQKWSGCFQRKKGRSTCNPFLIVLNFQRIVFKFTSWAKCIARICGSEIQSNDKELFVWIDFWFCLRRHWRICFCHSSWDYWKFNISIYILYPWNLISEEGMDWCLLK